MWILPMQSRRRSQAKKLAATGPDMLQALQVGCMVSAAELVVTVESNACPKRLLMRSVRVAHIITVAMIVAMRSS